MLSSFTDGTVGEDLSRALLGAGALPVAVGFQIPRWRDSQCELGGEPDRTVVKVRYFLILPHGLCGRTG